jgi:hypothetical protein
MNTASAGERAVRRVTPSRRQRRGGEEQADLFWQRRRRPPPPLERRTHCAVVDLLRVAPAPGWWWSHLASGEHRTPKTAALLQRLGLRRGLPDLMFVGPSGVCFLELKRRGAKPTPEQAEFLDRCRIAGIRCAVADSYDQAVNVLREWGVIRA